MKKVSAPKPKEKAKDKPRAPSSAGRESVDAVDAHDDLEVAPLEDEIFQDLPTTGDLPTAEDKGPGAPRAPVTAKAAAEKEPVEPPPLGDATITRVVGLLDHPRGERRTAAAIILLELAPQDEHVVAKLRDAVRRFDDVPLRRWACEAIGAIAPKTIVTDLQHLLKDADRGVRETAQRVLASGRGVKTADIAKMLDGTDEKERLAAIVVLGAKGGREARQRMLAQLQGASMKVTNAVIDALRPSLVSAQGQDARDAIEDIEAILDAKAIDADPDFGIAAIQLLAQVADEASAEPLISIAGGDAAPEVRSAAIDAIKKIARGKKVDPKVFKFLLECVESPKGPAEVTMSAIEALSGFEIPLALEPRVRALVTADNANARRWAIRALGTLDTAPAAKTLGSVVESGDPADREAALDVAKSTASGRAELARVLGRTTDIARARQIALTLRSKGEELEASTKQLLENAVVEVSTEIAEIIVEVLKVAGGQSASKVQENLLEKAMRLKKKAQYADAIAVFKSICHGTTADPETRYQMGLCELKASKKVIARGPSSDPCLATFAGLARAKDFDLVERLKTEMTLEPDELYYLGFTLAEGNDTDKAVGGDILSFLSEEEDTKLGRMAKNKLVTMGWGE